MNNLTKVRVKRALIWLAITVFIVGLAFQNAEQQLHAETSRIANDMQRYRSTVKEADLDRAWAWTPCARVSAAADELLAGTETPAGVSYAAMLINNAVADGCDASLYPEVARLMELYEARRPDWEWGYRLLYLWWRDDPLDQHLRKSLAINRTEAMCLGEPRRQARRTGEPRPATDDARCSTKA